MKDTDLDELKSQLADALESIKKLEGLNTTLKEENKAYSAKVREAKTAAEAAEAEKKKAAEEAARNSGNIEELEATLTARHKAERDADQKKITELSAMLTKTNLNHSIASALTENRARPEMAEVLTALVGSRADDKGMVDGKPAGEWLGEYLNSETGAHFRLPKGNDGTGAVGNTSSQIQEQHTFTKDNFNSKIGEWMQLQKTNPEKAASIAKDVGRTDLLS